MDQEDKKWLVILSICGVIGFTTGILLPILYCALILTHIAAFVFGEMHGLFRADERDIKRDSKYKFKDEPCFAPEEGFGYLDITKAKKWKDEQKKKNK